jgi:hypothetical protein
MVHQELVSHQNITHWSHTKGMEWPMATDEVQWLQTASFHAQIMVGRFQ